MTRKRKQIVAGMSLAAAMALTGATVAANAADRNSQAGQPAQVVAKAGKIVPINLISGEKGYSSDQAESYCCGPYAQRCPQYYSPG